MDARLSPEHVELIQQLWNERNLVGHFQPVIQWIPSGGYLLWAYPIHTTVYTWTDSTGLTHYEPVQWISSSF